ncbi:MAG: helix-turn-helix domain-containing protein [Peptococcaceae bacterium]|nr:TetR/AcrR family transcriptional regulator [Peptococcaceae bacterium]MDH7526379.1 helix-turn-helix domain-containing protein [Peptococcaceae bacterium]
MRLDRNKRRAQILETATRIFVEKGYHDTRTKQIAEACGVTEPVIYKHFRSKDELFLEVIASIAGETFNEISFDSQNDTEHIITSFVLNKAEKIESNFLLFKRLLSELLENEEIRRYYYHKYLPRLAYPLIGYLDQLKEQELIKKDVPSKVILLGLAGIMLIGSLAKNLEKESAFAEISGKELASQMLHIYLHGLIVKDKEHMA